MVLVEGASTLQHSSTHGEQVTEMQGAFLILVELWEQDRMRWLSDDGALEERARVQADDGAAVEQRLEIVVSCLSG